MVNESQGPDRSENPNAQQQEPHGDESELLDRLEIIKTQPLEQQAASLEQLYQELKNEVE